MLAMLIAKKTLRSLCIARKKNNKSPIMKISVSSDKFIFFIAIL